MLKSFTVAQTLEKPYEDFIAAYAYGNLDLIESAYTKDAVVIYLYANRQPKNVVGHENIVETFRQMFDNARSKNESMQISFKITSRAAQSPYVLDNGYYALKIHTKEEVRYNYGRFSIVLVEEDGRWRYVVDGNSGATKEEYDAAVALEYYH